MGIALLCMAVVPAMLGQGSARAEENPAITLCSYIIDRSGELIRSGQLRRARQMRPQLVKCVAVLQAEQLRQARELILQYDEAVRAAKGHPI